ncbi:hypothetical protein Tco_0931512 [Tanacetum coccineum]
MKNTRNWVANHVTGVVTPLNEKIDKLSARIEELLLARQYNNNGEGTSRFSRMSKLEFPKFYGDDVQGWMFKVKQFFSRDNIPEGDRVRMVSIHMHDTTLTWHLQFIESHGETGMEEEELLEEDESDMIEYELSETPHISLNTLSGVKGHVIKQILHILMDSGMFKMEWTKGGLKVSLLCCVRSSLLLYTLMHLHEGQDSNLNEELNQLLEESANVFTMPKELPSCRSFDHKIPLKT